MSNFRDWPPIHYLVQIFDSEPEKVLDILEQIPDTKNPTILAGIIDVALKSDSPDHIRRLAPKIMTFVEHARWEYDKIIELLKKPYFFEKSLNDFSFSLLTKLVEFLPDPQSEEKQKRQKENPEDWTTLLKPTPRFDEYKYQKILEEGVCPLAEKEPYQVFKILMDATAGMCRLHLHLEDLNRGKRWDFSETWCRRLSKLSRDDQDWEETLIRTLTFACEQVYEKTPELVAVLDGDLRSQKWYVFKRLRQHLYALYPSEQTKPWIRELILGHDGYNRWEHHYEFRQMIQCACEHFGAQLLAEEERVQIFDAIMSGPSKENFRERMGEQFTEDAFKGRQYYFHRLQFKPFSSVLFGKYKTYYQELEAEAKSSIKDEDYPPRGEIQTRLGFTGSPKSRGELAQFSDQELLDYINTWQDQKAYLDNEGNVIETSIQGLAEMFQVVFKESIIPDADRLGFWFDGREQIKRLIYVNAIIAAMQEHVKEEHFDQLDQWFQFCEWALSRPDKRDEKNIDLSSEFPGKFEWRESRRAVGDFVRACMEKDTNVPMSARESLAKLLKMLCTQPDWQLDHGIAVTNMDQLTEAINNTRSRALEDLVKFGFWVRRNDTEEAEVSEVASILEERFKPEAKCPLTLPEYAILGTQYWSIYQLNPEWAKTHKSNFFPKDNSRAWPEAFGCFLRYNHPFKPIFEVMREDFVFALGYLAELKQGGQLDQERPPDKLPHTFGELREYPTTTKEEPPYELPYILGQHLFKYYLWDVYPLKGSESLLERYYQKTDGNRALWSRLFSYIGRLLRNSGEHLDENLKERIFAFFEWRYKANEPMELQKFIFWLEAKCLDAEWRLDQYSKILDVSQPKHWGLSTQVEMLTKVLLDHPAKALECFTKLTGSIEENDTVYIHNIDEAKSILNVGLASENESMRNNAKLALENLLHAGYSNSLSEYL